MERSGLPVWLLDVDGVINALSTRQRAWPETDLVERYVDGKRIVVARPVLDFITATHEAKLAEIRWHTTWQGDAQMIADEFGLPAFPVHEAPEFHAETYSYAAHKDGWWKLKGARRVLEVERRPLLWTDDDIGRAAMWGLFSVDGWRALGAELAAGYDGGNLCFVSPYSPSGLSPKNLVSIAEFLEHPSQPRISVSFGADVVL